MAMAIDSAAAAEGATNSMILGDDTGDDIAATTHSTVPGGHSHCTEEPISEDEVKRILSQPQDEMNIVRLLNADPLIRSLLLRNPLPVLESQDSIADAEELEDMTSEIIVGTESEVATTGI